MSLCSWKRVSFEIWVSIENLGVSIGVLFPNYLHYLSFRAEDFSRRGRLCFFFWAEDGLVGVKKSEIDKIILLQREYPLQKGPQMLVIIAKLNLSNDQRASRTVFRFVCFEKLAGLLHFRNTCLNRQWHMAENTCIFFESLLKIKISAQLKTLTWIQKLEHDNCKQKLLGRLQLCSDLIEKKDQQFGICITQEELALYSSVYMTYGVIFGGEYFAKEQHYVSP